MGPLDVTAWYNGQNYWFQSSWGQAFRQQDGTDAPVIWSEEASVDGHFVPINIVQIPIREGGPLSGALMRMGASRKWVLAMGPAVSQSG